MLNSRVPLLLRQWMYNLRGGFLVRPLIIAVALGAAGATLSWLEELFPLVSAWVPTAIFPSHADPQVAQVILGSIGASIMTVVSIVFAILLMTLTLASMQFSPRIILGFATDGVTQWTLGIFLGTFCYCMAALPAARSLPHPFSPVATVLGAMLLALACVAWLLFFIHHISHAISVNHMVDRIASETERIVDEMMPWPRKPNHFAVDERIDALVWESTLLSETSGYIRFIDTARVLGLAKQYRVKIRIMRRVGHFVPAGVPLALVSRAERTSAELVDQLQQAIDIGPSRTLQQDIEFGILQIVDIALKAISPAVNDPSTAISCVDQLSRILIRVASREAPEPGLYDPPGNLRVWIPWIDFEGLFQTAFEQIRWYGRADVAVSLRLLRALGDIASTVDDQTMRTKIVERARCVVVGCGEQLGEEALIEMRARLAVMERPRDNLN
jgi:uncharacterized membrane protein